MRTLDQVWTGYKEHLAYVRDYSVAMGINTARILAARMSLFIKERLPHNTQISQKAQKNM